MSCLESTAPALKDDRAAGEQASPTAGDALQGVTVQPGDDCLRCGGTVETAAYGVVCASHRCDWHEYRTGSR